MGLRALAWALSEEERAARFLSLTGITPDSLRESVGDPAVTVATFGFLMAHEPDLLACAADLEVQPATLAAAARRGEGLGADE